MQVENLNKSASGDFNLNLKLSNDEPALDESEYPTLSFTYDDTAKTATVAANYSNQPTGALVIPAKVMHNGEKYTITTIGGSEGFGECSITSVEIPTSVTIIKGYAFVACQNLTSITIPASITSIGVDAFQSSGLRSASFEITTGWTVTPYNDNPVNAKTPTISSTDLNENATLLTGTYYYYTWTRA